jgi:hypothetical protein
MTRFLALLALLALSSCAEIEAWQYKRDAPYRFRHEEGRVVVVEDEL